MRGSGISSVQERQQQAVPTHAVGRAPGSGRIEAIDFARGLAVALMILSHGTNALLPFSDFPDWGQVPVHALTKFSSSLFVIVFGVALAVAFVPKAGSDDWPRRRNKLLLRGLVVLLWYKLLTVVEMYELHEREAIIDTLLYRDFPSFVEILGFYAIALLWVPFLLPLWARMPALLRWASPVLMALACWWLLENFGFWGVPQLQALIVEHPDYYTWGQLARGPLILLGLLIGGLLLRAYDDPAGARRWRAGWWWPGCSPWRSSRCWQATMWWRRSARSPAMPASIRRACCSCSTAWVARLRCWGWPSPAARCWRAGCGRSR